MNTRKIVRILAVLSTLLTLSISAMVAQSTVPFLKKNSQDKVQAYTPPPAAEKLELSYAELENIIQGTGASTTASLGGKIGLCTSVCGQETFSTANLAIQFDLGEDYTFGKELPEPVSLTVEYEIGYKTTSTGACLHFPGKQSSSAVFQLDMDNPEKRLLVDLTNEMQGVGACSVEMCLVATFSSLTNVSSAVLRDAVRLRSWIVTESTVRARPSYQPWYTTGEETQNPPLLATLKRVGPTTSTVTDNPVTFAWDGITCRPNYPLYQLQVLRLYNRDESKTDEKDVTVEIDWDRALTMETTTTSVALTLAEDRGYYIWRVRPIGNAEPGGILNPLNWGVWTSSPLESMSHVINATPSPDVLVTGIFFYDGFDEDINWSLQRSHSGHGQFVESIQYATEMLRVEQSQVQFQSQDERIVSQTLYDNVGRPALQTLPLPYVGAEKQLAYLDRSILMTANSAEYSANDFDNIESTYYNPTALDGGALHEYYSGGTNSEDYVASAQGYPFFQTKYYADGTNSARESSGPGLEHRIGSEHTSRTSYSGATEEELIRLFGDDAPAASSVRKVFSTDPNGSSSVSYYSKSGALLASGLVKTSASNPLVEELADEVLFPSPSQPANEGLITVNILPNPSAVNNSEDLEMGQKLLWGQKIELNEPQTVMLKYGIDKQQFYNDCLNLCAECDFQVVIKIVDLECNQVVNSQNEDQNDDYHWVINETPTSLNFDNDGASCAQMPPARLYWPNPQDPNVAQEVLLEPGSYRIERELRFGVPEELPGDDGYTQSRRAWYRTGIENHILELADKLDDGSGLDDITLESLNEMFFSAEAMREIEELETFYQFIYDHYGGLTWDLSCGVVKVPFEQCPEVETPPESQEWVALLENSLGENEIFGTESTYTIPDPITMGHRMAWFCGLDDPVDPHPAHPDLHNITSTQLVNLLDNIRADYSSDDADLWNCWQGAIDRRARLPELSEQVYCTSLLDMFFECAGFEPDAIQSSLSAYADYQGPGKGLEYAHKQFFDPTHGNSDPDLNCRDLADDSELIDPSLEYRQSVYRCILTSATRPNANTSEIDANEDRVQDYLDDPIANAINFDEECESRCEERREEFEDAIYLAYQLKFPGILKSEIPELTDLTDKLVDECEAACGALADDNIFPRDVNQIELDELLPEIENAFNFMHSMLKVEIVEASEDCPSGFERCGQSPSIVSVDWDDIAEDRIRIINEINEQIEVVRSRIIDGADVLDELNSFRTYVEGQFYAMVGTVGCPGTWPNDDGSNTEFEGMSQAIFEQLVSLVQMNQINHFTVRLDVDTENCDLVMSVVLALDDTCPDVPTPTAGHFGSNLDEYSAAQLTCLIEADLASSGRPYCQLLCDEFCKGLSSPAPSMCVNFIDADEFSELAQSGTERREKTCGELVLPIIRNKLYKRLYNLIAESQAAVIDEYYSVCGNFESLNETFTAEYKMNYYHFTLYYYDRAGRLIKTVPPKGFDEGSTGHDRSQTPTYDHQTTYAYNSLGELVATESPDAGLAVFYYNEAGQLLVSQNSDQLDKNTPANNQFSYSEYDEFGRPVEAGEGMPFSAVFDVNVGDLPTNNKLSAIKAIGTKSEVTRTFYDDDNDFETTLQATYKYITGSDDPIGTGLCANCPGPLNRRHRVAASVANWEDNDNRVITVYSYDDHGNVEWIIQDIPTLAKKYLRYEYNLLTGNTDRVLYNEGFVDQFYHCYEYDLDNRLSEVWTSDDGEFWDRDAEYSFYKHGALKRTEIGEDRVQGLDYVYTVHGWLKGINFPELTQIHDPGQDGISSSSRVAQDAFGMMLGYYKQDYVRDGTNSNAFEYSQAHIMYDGQLTGADPGNLYNGNIATLQVGHSDDAGILHSGPGMQTGYRFSYDQLNRLTNADFRKGLPGGAWTDVAGKEFDVAYEYDPNGNLKRLTRYGGDPSNPLMDDFFYEYPSTTNQLRYVSDLTVPASRYSTDIDDQTPPNPSSPDNYRYDETGRLISDAAEGISQIEWTAYHTVKQITYASNKTVSFTYDATGQRVHKSVVENGVTTKTFYVRDAVGTVVATYVDDPNDPNPGSLKVENPIYGAGRVGVQTRSYLPTQDIIGGNIAVVPEVEGGGVMYERTVCQKMYELTDHLGNVRVVVSDIKIGTSLGVGPFKADVQAINNYYPYGMLQPGRHMQSESYRYAFGGHEKDDDIKGTGNSYTTTFRQYDPRLGRWLSIDPVVHPFQSPYNAFDGNPVFFSDPSGGNSKESTPIEPAPSGGTSTAKTTGNGEAVINGVVRTMIYNSPGVTVTGEDLRPWYTMAIDATAEFSQGVGEGFLQGMAVPVEFVANSLWEHTFLRKQIDKTAVDVTNLAIQSFNDPIGTAEMGLIGLKDAGVAVWNAPAREKGALAGFATFGALSSFGTGGAGAGVWSLRGVSMSSRFGRLTDYFDDIVIDRWTPINGPGPAGGRTASTFRSSTYEEVLLLKPLTLYRVHNPLPPGDGWMGGYWSTNAPSGPLQSGLDLALLPEWSNTMAQVTTIQVPAGTTIFRGVVGAQRGTLQKKGSGRVGYPWSYKYGGGQQTLLSERVQPEWFIKTETFRDGL